MLSKFLLLIFCIPITIASLAGVDPNYSIASIPQALLKNANIVFRNYEVKVEIENLGKMRVTEKYAVTILNEAGERYAGFAEYYDKLCSVKEIDGRLYDATGNKIRELKKSEIKDVSYVSDISLFEDNRLKLHNFYCKNFPYTVEYEFEKTYDGTFYVPDFMPQRDYFVSVEKSDYSITVPSSANIVFKKINTEKEPVIITESKGAKKYRWDLKDLRAIKKEVLSQSLTRVAPAILISLAEFEVEGYKGSNSSWKEFGKFIYDLKKNREELPEVIKQQVKNLTDGVQTNGEKIKKLYEYLQANTRYISIQLGIGGWQPFDAKYVANNRYGDCKALSNYMYALLKQAGIPSLYALIRAGDGEDDIFVDFPTNQFNHAILCVPNDNDTIWLECTSQYSSAGYMGSFTGNRHALLIAEDGGSLAQTPIYRMGDNLQVRKIKATLDDDATLNFESNARYFAMRQDDLHGYYTHVTKEKLKEHLQSRFDFSTYNINKFEYNEQKGKIPAMNEWLDISVANYATVTGKRLFILPNIMNRTNRRLSADSTRKFDLDMGFPYKDVDSVEIQIPPGFSQETVPQDAHISSKFAVYRASVLIKDGKIFYSREMEYRGGVFPATDYPELVKFYEAVFKADRSRIVFVKKEDSLKPF